METSESRLWRHCGVTIVNSEHSLHSVLFVDFEQVIIERDMLLRSFNLNYHLNCIYVTMTTFSILHFFFKIYYTFRSY